MQNSGPKIREGWEGFAHMSFDLISNTSTEYRIVVAYNVCSGKPKELKTQYQQTTRYCQNITIKQSPKEPTRKDFAQAMWHLEEG